MVDRICWGDLEDAFAEHSVRSDVQAALIRAGVDTWPLAVITTTADTIATAVEEIEPGWTEFVLRNSRKMWWKGISLHQWTDGPLIAACVTQDSRTVAPALRFRTAEIAGLNLVLSKATFLGAQTDMYEIPVRELGRGGPVGKRFTVVWVRD